MLFLQNQNKNENKVQSPVSQITNITNTQNNKNSKEENSTLYFLNCEVNLNIFFENTLYFAISCWQQKENITFVFEI